ncbi:MAG TPA: class I SAM-dependent methyltransferase [Anaerolineales bacterium]|nr:class I SAM-dependent methyltransferase [Anaerolineales bacterium]
MEAEVKERVRRFYDSIGWQEIGEGVYQNARYEDLRPVSREYIHRCHIRLARHLRDQGDFFLDAGSGPIQYPEYLTYSQGFRCRVCLDISRRALLEARKRIGEHGLYVQGDVAHLPFRKNAFQSVASLHTLHHLPAEQQKRAFCELSRVTEEGGRCAVVYSWGARSALMRLLRPVVASARAAQRIRQWLRAARQATWKQRAPDRGGGRIVLEEVPGSDGRQARLLTTPGSYTFHHSAAWMGSHLRQLPELDVRVWRSLSTEALRALIHDRLLGRAWLRLLFWMEERAPHFFGRVGQYPLVLFGGGASWRRTPNAVDGGRRLGADFLSSAHEPCRVRRPGRLGGRVADPVTQKAEKNGLG